MTGLGLDVPPSEANFVSVFFESPEVAADFRQHLRQRAKVVLLGDDSDEYDIRGFSGGFARICLPSPGEFPRLQESLAAAVENLLGTTT